MPIPHRYRVITGALLLPLALAACSSKGSAPNHTQPAITPAAAVSPHASAQPGADQPGAKMGVPFRNGSFEITVTKVDTGLQSLPISNEDTANGIKPPTPKNGQYIVVHITAKNVGNAPAACSDFSSKLMDADGKTYDQGDILVGVSLVGDELGTGSDQQPDTTRSGLLVFDVPPSLTKPTTLLMQSDAYVGTSNPPTPVSLLG